MKRIFTLIAVALIATAMPVEAQKIKRANEAISRASELMQNARYDEACLYARMGNVERALDALRLALSLGYKAKAHIENDDELDPIRHTEAYQRLMEEYFNE